MARLAFEGMDELREALRSMPRELVDEASGIVMQTAQEAKDELLIAYEDVSGDLDAGVRVTSKSAGFVAGALLESRAPHAHLYEYGTQMRKTASGANRGAMPTKPTLVPIAVRKRREMRAKLKAMLTREGLEVSGDG